MCTVSQTDKQCCWVSFDFPHRTDFSGFSVARFKSRFKVKRGMQFVECLLRTDAGPSSARSLALLGPSTVSPAIPAGSEWKNENQKFKASPDGRRPVLNRNQQKNAGCGGPSLQFQPVEDRQEDQEFTILSDVVSSSP